MRVDRGAASRPSVHPVLGLVFERGPGCSFVCSLQYGHDPITHEAWGRDAARAELAAARSGVVRTGPLEVDFDVTRVSVNGVVIAMGPIEFGLLTLLAARLGRVVRHREMVEAVWDQPTADLWGADQGNNRRWHGLRINVLRLRQRLGDAGALLETVHGFGYRLRDQPPAHHLNGVRSDNRLENLELWKLSQPSGVRQADYHCPGCRCEEAL